MYYQTQDAWKENPGDTKLADKHLKAWRDWQDANEEYERARRRANWVRAKRIITLAAAGRDVKVWANTFEALGFNVEAALK
jgi:hypothetical protein